MRGPGETKLEVDRRVVRRARSRRSAGASTRWRGRAARSARAVCAPACPLIALAGYTNAGKSTLLNALTDADVSVRDRLFETLDPTSRSYRYRDRDYVLTDTVGFIRKLPHQLVDAFASTLEETTLADVVLVVADAALEPRRSRVREKTVADVLEMIGSTRPADPRLQQDRPRRRRQAPAAARALPGGRVHRRRPRPRARALRERSGSLLRPRPAAGAPALPVCGGRRDAPSARHRQRRPRGAHLGRRRLRGAGCPPPRPGATRASASTPSLSGGLRTRPLTPRTGPRTSADPPTPKTGSRRLLEASRSLRRPLEGPRSI